MIITIKKIESNMKEKNEKHSISKNKNDLKRMEC